jgi:phenylalanyl-tRNA synthetase beta chain
LAVVAGGGIGTEWDRHLEFDLFDLKGALEGLAARFGLELQVVPARLPGFVEGTAAVISVGGEQEAEIGYMGRLAGGSSSLPLFAAEIGTARFEVGDVPQVVLPSRFPAVEMDLTLTHGSETSWAELQREISAAEVADLVEVALKFRYSGDGVPDGAVNTTIGFLYNAVDRSLTQDEVNERHEAVRQRVTDRFGWKESQ